jgi:plasmid stability protein
MPEGKMASLTIRNLDEPIKARLRVRAAQRGHSMEEEVRQILRTALSVETEVGDNLAEAIRKRFEPLGGVELPEIEREPGRQPPDFS